VAEATSVGRYTNVASLTPSPIGTICLPKPWTPYFGSETLGAFHRATVVNRSNPRSTMTTSWLGSKAAMNRLSAPMMRSSGRVASCSAQWAALTGRPLTVSTSSLCFW
jgi:hypothetical protein